ncbi:MAG: carboxypeptidase-like regulatory domain-containing protein, partial [Cyclobacteriaceae bacterium]
MPAEKPLAGYVRSKSGVALAHAVVYVRSDSRIVHYTLTDSAGYFRFPPNAVITRNDTLVIRLLGYEEANYRVGDIYPDPDDLLIELNERIGVLEEVIIRPKENRIPFNDTTSIVIKPNEGEKQTLEDVLKKLPGFSVDDEGNIGYKGRPVKKIFLEGADLTSTNYKRISRSMTSESVSRIDVIERFVENKLLGGLVVSDEVVLNLAIDSLRKNRPFGNANLAFGNKGYRNLGGNGFLVNPAYKAHAQAHTNNIGLRSDPTASALQRVFNAGVFHSEELNSPVLKYRQFAPGDFGNTNINNEHQFGLAGVLQSRNRKLKWNHDVSLLFDAPSQVKKDSLSVVFGASTTDQFQSLDVYTTTNKLLNVYIRNRLIWSLNETQQLDISTHLNGSESRFSNLLSQDVNTSEGRVSDVIDESIRTEMLQADILLEYTNRFQSNRALQVNFNAGHNTYPQQLALFSNQERFVYPPRTDSAYAVMDQHLVNTNRQTALKIRMLNTYGRYTYEIFGEAAYNQAEYGSRVWNPEINNIHQLVVKRWFTEAGLNMGFSLNKISGVTTATVRLADFQSLGSYRFPYWNSKISWNLSRRSRLDGEFLYTWYFPEIHQMAGFYYYNDFNLLKAGLGSAGYQRSTSLTGSYRYEDLRSFWNIQATAGIRHRAPDYVSDLSITPLITIQRLFLSQRTTSAFSETEVTKFIPRLKVRVTSAFTAS